MMHKFVDQEILNSILNQNLKVPSDAWTSGPVYQKIPLNSINNNFFRPPKNLIIKIHPEIFDKISGEFGPFTKDPINPEMYRGKDPFTTFYVTKKASMKEIEIMELPAPRLFGGHYL
jgi:hypothetical protein